MPWSQTTPMDQKTQFIADYLRESFSFSELCARYGVSRETGYRLVERYLERGPAGLQQRSRRPHTSPNQTAPHVVEALLELRRRHPRWGAKKLIPILLGCQGLLSTSVADSKPVFTRLFKEYGLPKRIRTDNGVPFATNTLARLSSLSAWWVRLGVLPELIEPGKPQQNGRHERMHKTLKADTTRPPAASCRAQQRKFNRFREEFNDERPHEGLDMHTPASCYEPSRREMPAKPATA